LKPRIYFYGNDLEFSGSLFVSLNDVLKLNLDLINKKYFIHVGFNSLDTKLVRNLVKEFPSGFYCSAAFEFCKPGVDWIFSEPIKNDKSIGNILYIKKAPFSYYEASEETISKINILEETSRKYNFENVENLIADELLLEQPFSERTKSFFKRYKIYKLSDLAKYTAKEISSSANVGVTTLTEIEEYLTKHDLSFDKIKDTKIRLKNLQVIDDELLLNHNFSARTENVFEEKKIYFLSDLIQYNRKQLLKFPNFGVKSLREINQYLSERNLVLGQEVEFNEFNKEFKHENLDIKPFSNSFIKDISEAINGIDNIRQREIILHRSGLNELMTLEELGQNQGVTRERIRQIQKKGLKTLLKKNPNFFMMYYFEILEKIKKYDLPLKLENIANLDSKFDSEDVTMVSNCVKFIIYWVNKFNYERDVKPLDIVAYNNENYISLISSDKIVAIKQQIRSVLEGAKRDNLHTVKNESLKFINDAQLSFFNLIWEEEKRFCLIVSNENNEEIFVKYVGHNNTERAVILCVDFVRRSKEPVSTQALIAHFSHLKLNLSNTSILNQITKDDNLFPMAHGLWGTLEHINYTGLERKTIINEANKFLDKQGKKQFHAREIADRLTNKISSNLNYFHISAILRKHTDYIYLGRSVFASKDSGLKTRIHIHDIAVNTLRLAEKPMHKYELVKEVNKYISIGSNGIYINPPLINIGKNIIALDFWADDILGSYASQSYLELNTRQRMAFNFLSSIRNELVANTKDDVIHKIADTFSMIKNEKDRINTSKDVVIQLIKVGLLKDKNNYFEIES
jgi:hypothetical protein